MVVIPGAISASAAVAPGAGAPNPPMETLVTDCFIVTSLTQREAVWHHLKVKESAALVDTNIQTDDSMTKGLV